MALIATYPLMTVSTQQATRSKRLQAQLPSHKKERANALGTIEDIAEVCTLWPTKTSLQSLVPSQAIDCTLRATSDILMPPLQIVRESGWQGLFQGLQASLVGTAVSQVQHPYLLEEMIPSLAMARFTFLRGGPGLGMLAVLKSGSAGGILLFLFSPPEILCGQAAETQEDHQRGRHSHPLQARILPRDTTAMFSALEQCSMHLLL